MLLLSWSLMGRLGGIPRLPSDSPGASLPRFRSSSAESERFAALVPFFNAVGFVLGSLFIGD